MELIEKITISNDASIAFTAIREDEFSVHALLFQIIPANDNVLIYAQFSTDGGATWDNGTVYPNCYFWARSNATGYGADGNTEISIAGGQSNESHSGAWGRIHMFNLGSSSLYKPFRKDIGNWDQASIVYVGIAAGIYQRTSPVNAIKLWADSGNLSSGFAALYGM